MRRFLVAFAAAFLALGSTVALASWIPGNGGSGTSTARSVGLPTSVTATATSSSTVRVAWSAPGGPSVTPSQYVVRRTAPTTAVVCTVALPTTCDDTGLAASTTYSYTVEATIGASWSSGQTTPTSATTPSGPTLKVSVAVGNKTAGTAFTVTLTATTNGVATNTAYSGVKTITFSGPGNAPSGAAPTYPASVTFASGVGTASVTLRNVETVGLAASDGTISGSTSVTVVAGAASQLKYTSSSVDCSSGSVTVGNGGSFTSKVTAYDAFLNPKTGARTVNLTKSPTNTGSMSPTSLSIAAAGSETSASFTFTLNVGNPANTTVTAASSGLTSAACIVKK
ncbi:MAG: fibronectin type III domain-containing protein [Acidimicrobiia bacterium]